MTLPGNRKLVCVGSYRLTGRRLGKGNFAKVEEAMHTVLKTKVALKIINISEIKEEYVIRNLHREARLMSQLSHPCIANLFETMQNGNMYYLVTELAGGGDLCNFIKSQRGGKLEERTTKIFGRQLVSAVAYMHGMGIVHRDLKMENIMLNDTRTQLKIVDFGLSNSYNADTPLRTHCGSPEYAAPELFVTGQLYGPQVDLWSLGVILYGMVLGHLPFITSRDSKISSHDRRTHLLQQINRGLAPAHRKALANFTVEFRAMLARLLMPDPSKRIRVAELVRHPWLTERNRKQLRTSGHDILENSVKNLETSSRLRVIGTRNIVKSYSLRSGAKPSTQQEARTPVSKTTPDAIASRRTKSEPLPQPTKTTTASTTQKSSERATKRKSEQLQQQQPARHSSARKSAPTTSSRSRSGATRTAGSSHGCRHGKEQLSAHGHQQSSHGSCQPRAPQSSAVTTEHQLGKRLLNEPIARCIAGYVGKYMNGHGEKFRWIKEFASFHHPGTVFLAETN